MADGVDIDLYADDLDQGFPIKVSPPFCLSSIPLKFCFFFLHKDEFNDDVDLYDDVIAAPSSEPHDRSADNATPASQIDRAEQHDTNGGFSHGSSGNGPSGHMGRRHQLYVGNLTWWTTDQDINDACHEIGVSDFQDVKFFENRTNGQSKGFCLISLASESSMRLCMDRLPKRDLHGQSPVVTLPTKQALNQFESQQKTRPVPPTTNNGPGPRVPGPGLLPSGPPQSQSGGMGGGIGGRDGGGGGGGGIGRDGGGGGYQSNHQSSRMMNPNGPPQYRPHGMQSQSMQGGPPRMQQPLMQHNPMGGGPQSQGGPPRYQSQNQWNGPPRPNGPPRSGLPNGPQGGPSQHRPMTLLPHPSTHHQQPPQQQQYQGGPQGPGGGMPPRGPRPDWNRPPMHGGGGGGGYQQGGPPGGGHPQGPPHMQGPPRGSLPPPQMGGPHGPPQGGPAPHVNPAFFNQGGGPPQHQGGPPLGGGPPHGGPHNMSGHGGGPPAHYQQQGGGPPRGPWPGPPIKQGGGVFGDPMPQLNEVEFEEIMARNRTVSSSAIARAVSDAAAGEYSSAIETLVTAISLIKQSKVAHDERCKILISSLQDTLHGIETKSYSRRDRSRSRERSHRRPRRERSTSRSYRERSRERDRERERERDG